MEARHDDPADMAPPERGRYIPIDVRLDQSWVRIFRALRHFEWITAHDLLDALDLPLVGPARAAFGKALERAVKRRQVRKVRTPIRLDGKRRRKRSTHGYRYQLTERGRRRLVRELAPPPMPKES